MIENNTNLGLFNESNELVAWCLKLDFGSLAALQVDEKHLRKGYGEIVTKAISKKIAVECDVDVTCNIIHANFKSKNLFLKLGFEELDNNFWIGVKKSE
jgi:predicted GNAT family acetyltransferase